MINNDKLCCWLSWNLFLRIGIGFLLFGIPFGLYEFKPITLYQLFSGFGVLVGFYLFYKRNIVFEKQLVQKDEQYIKENQFKSFIDSTKLLTYKDSTNGAKISALYLLYDTAEQHKNNISRIIQVINKQITPLINHLEGKHYKPTSSPKLSSKKQYLYPYKIIKEYTYRHNDTISLDINDEKSRKIIKEWQYNGNDTEQLISVSLSILKKIFLNISENNEAVDLSNTILFDLDSDYDKDEIKIPKIKKPIENIIFLNCKLHEVDFSEIIYHQASFINCDLKDCNFAKATLWGALFQNCNLKNVNFNNTECEATEFKNCTNLASNQLKLMNFKYLEENKRNDDKKYLIIYDKDFNEISKKEYFTSLDEFNKWRYGNDRN